MGLTYFKRYRMELDLWGRKIQFPNLPEGYTARPWRDSLLEAHAEAKYQSFRIEIDANVFPCLGQLDGCRRLMREISSRDGFLGEATWLLESSRHGEIQFCGTIQGVRDGKGFGAVQNLGITPAHRGRGLGTHLLFHALLGFKRAGLRRAFLEVTAQNEGAVRLYQRLGFRRVKTVYKAGEVAYA